ncbi:o-succinylbenzoate synthase [uncultured Thiohalocapsa sp.]|uniref:o-succinylbenzoate synthase n=1 Tax=uncultured Thiohalocapsa sp. TaxID=768990 RepID=UPI0025DD73BC|nr:o-succinylbenzoate synthase [uncultured Thiohalocapsa sp.]
MTDLRLLLHPYRLPLRRPWRTARDTLAERTGWLVHAEADGASGFGDCAPLPAAGTETAAQAAQRLAHWRARAGEGVAALLAALAIEPSATPAADCAVETALLDLCARQRGLPLRRLLHAAAPDQLAVNAMLGAAGTLHTAAVEQALAAGFRVLKVKLGTAPPAEELARLEAAAALLPAGAALRLDANGAFDATSAAACIAEVAGLPIDCLEEPLATPDDAALAHLQATAPFSLALDESLAGRPDLHPARLPVRRLVLKPAVVGGLRRTLRLATQAHAAGREVVLTSLVESAAGLWATAQLAAATGGPLAHGLATADWLAADLGAAPMIDAGSIMLPEAPGSGFMAFDDQPQGPDT